MASAYQNELTAAQERVNTGLAKRKQEPFTLPDKIRDIYALPQSALCIPSAYLENKAPEDCSTAAFKNVLGNDGVPTLYVVSARLDEAMRGGVADAACLFAPDTSMRSTLICKLASESN